MAKKPITQDALNQFRHNARLGLKKLIWNVNRLARITAKDTPEEIKAKLVVLALSPDDSTRELARIRLGMLT